VFAMLFTSVTELYGAVGGYIYCDHLVHGRVHTTLELTSQLYSMGRTLVELQGLELDMETPAGKAELEVYSPGPVVRGWLVKARVGVDVPPLAAMALDVRNLRALAELSLGRLVRLGALAAEEASHLLAVVLRGESLLVVGPTGSGKTTLCNALLALLPPDRRLMAVEYVRELEDLSQYGKAMHRYLARTLGKTGVIEVLLHRNPDVLFMGEIIAREDLDAYTLAHQSAMQAIATTHARSPASLVDKLYRLGTDPEELSGVHVCVMSKERRVAGLYRLEGGEVREERLDTSLAHLVAKLPDSNLQAARAAAGWLA